MRVEAALEVAGRLDVDRDPVRAGVQVFRKRPLRVLDHQVDVEGQPRGLAQRPDDRRADRQVRHEVAVHDVDVDDVGSARFDHRQGVRQAGEVRGQQGRRDTDVHDRGGAGGSADRETVSETTSRVESG